MKYFVLLIIILISCGDAPEVSTEESTEYTESPYSCHPDTLEKWKEWAQNSDEGLWEEDPDHSITLTYTRSYAGEEDATPAFYSIRDLEIAGDSIFIADHKGFRIVCMGVDGSVIWDSGEQGEGPGHYNSIYSIAVNDEYVLAADAGLNKVEILDRSGELLELVTVLNPNDVLFINDSTFAVLSSLEPGGDVHVYRCSGEKLFSFGEGYWYDLPENLIMRTQDSFNCLMMSDSVLLVSRWETYHIYPYHIGSRNVQSDIARPYPSEAMPPDIRFDDGVMNGMFYRNMGKLFIGPEGMLNVELPGFSTSGDILTGRNEERGCVKIVDRYDWDWNYLDSYCIPFNGGVQAYSEEYGYFVHDYETETLLRFTAQVGK